MTDSKKDVPFSSGRSKNAALTGPVDEFLADLRARKLSPQTTKKRKDDLRKLLVYLDARSVESLADVDLKTLEAYRFALVDHGYGDSSIESALRAASLFFRFLEERGHLFENPARRLKVPKAPVIMGTVLTEKEIRQLLAQPDVTRPRGLRDRAILEVLYSTGMRRGEAVALSVFDVHLDEATVKVTGKGRKQRLLPLGKHAVKYLRLYMKEARPTFCPKLCPAPDALWLVQPTGSDLYYLFCVDLTCFCADESVPLALGVSPLALRLLKRRAASCRALTPTSPRSRRSSPSGVEQARPLFV